MNNLLLILVLSAVLWYCIDRIKPMWAELKFGKYVTMAVAGAGSVALVFGFGLDLIVAMGLMEEVTLIGKILTSVILMSGSSAVSEVIDLIKSIAASAKKD